MVILLGYVVSLAMAAASLACWRHSIPFNMRLLYGYDRWQDRGVPRVLVFNRYFGTAFLAVMAIAVFIGSTVEVVRLIL